MAALAKKVCLVLGAGGPGIGANVARKFAGEGYSVAVASRTKERVQALASAIEKESGNDTLGVTCDVSDKNSVISCVEEVEKALGPIHTLIYNAGSGVFKTYDQLTEEEFTNSWRVNALGLFNVAQQIGPKMVSNGGGVIGITGATASLRGKPFTAAFAPAKGAQRLFAQSLARQLGPDNVHVFLVYIDGMVNLGRNKNKPDDEQLNPKAIADTYHYLATQEKTAWTFEMDLRPCKESW